MVHVSHNQNHLGELIKSKSSCCPLAYIWIGIYRTRVQHHEISTCFQVIQWLTKFETYRAHCWWRMSLSHIYHWIPDYWGGEPWGGLCGPCPGSGGIWLLPGGSGGEQPLGGPLGGGGLCWGWPSWRGWSLLLFPILWGGSLLLITILCGGGVGWGSCCGLPSCEDGSCWGWSSCEDGPCCCSLSSRGVPCWGWSSCGRGPWFFPGEAGENDDYEDFLVGVVPVDVDHPVGVVRDSSQEEVGKNDDYEDPYLGVFPAEVHHFVRMVPVQAHHLVGVVLAELHHLVGVVCDEVYHPLVVVCGDVYHVLGVFLAHRHHLVWVVLAQLHHLVRVVCDEVYHSFGGSMWWCLPSSRGVSCSASSPCRGGLWKSSTEFELFASAVYGTRREAVGDGRLPSHFDLSWPYQTPFLQNLSLNYPSSFLLPPSLCGASVHPYTSDVES